MSISHERIAPRCLSGKVISSVDGSEFMAEVPPWVLGYAADVQMRHRRRAHNRQNRPRYYARLGAPQRLHRTGVAHCSLEAEAKVLLIDDVLGAVACLLWSFDECTGVGRRGGREPLDT